MNPAPEATVWFRVDGRINFPIRANESDLLVVIRPPHPENLWVIDPLGRWVIRRGHFPEGKLWTVLADLADAGTLTLIHAPGAQLLPHLLQSGQVAHRAAIRALSRVHSAG